MFIGFTGYAGAGKDAAAETLINGGFVLIKMAAELKRALMVLDPQVGGGYRYNEVVTKYGEVQARQMFPEIRRLQQVFGTDVGRNMWGENFWVDRAVALVRKYPSGTNFVCTDMRFPNEVLGIVPTAFVYVDRPGVGPINAHISDAGLVFDMATHTITNDGTLEELHTQVWGVVNSVRESQGFPLN